MTWSFLFHFHFRRFFSFPSSLSLSIILLCKLSLTLVQLHIQLENKTRLERMRRTRGWNVNVKREEKKWDNGKAKIMSAANFYLCKFLSLPKKQSSHGALCGTRQRLRTVENAMATKGNETRTKRNGWTEKKINRAHQMNEKKEEMLRENS